MARAERPEQLAAAEVDGRAPPWRRPRSAPRCRPGRGGRGAPATTSAPVPRVTRTGPSGGRARPAAPPRAAPGHRRRRRRRRAARRPATPPRARPAPRAGGAPPRRRGRRGTTAAGASPPGRRGHDAADGPHEEQPGGVGVARGRAAEQGACRGGSRRGPGPWCGRAGPRRAGSRPRRRGAPPPARCRAGRRPRPRAHRAAAATASSSSPAQAARGRPTARATARVTSTASGVEVDARQRGDGVRPAPPRRRAGGRPRPGGTPPAAARVAHERRALDTGPEVSRGRRGRRPTTSAATGGRGVVHAVTVAVLGVEQGLVEPAEGTRVAGSSSCGRSARRPAVDTGRLEQRHVTRQPQAIGVGDTEGGGHGRRPRRRGPPGRRRARAGDRRRDRSRTGPADPAQATAGSFRGSHAGEVGEALVVGEDLDDGLVDLRGASEQPLDLRAPRSRARG